MNIPASLNRLPVSGLDGQSSSADASDSSPDDFQSMLSAIWYAPVTQGGFNATPGAEPEQSPVTLGSTAPPVLARLEPDLSASSKIESLPLPATSIQELTNASQFEVDTNGMNATLPAQPANTGAFARQTGPTVMTEIQVSALRAPAPSFAETDVVVEITNDIRATNELRLNPPVSIQALQSIVASSKAAPPAPANQISGDDKFAPKEGSANLTTNGQTDPVEITTGDNKARSAGDYFACPDVTNAKSPRLETIKSLMNNQKDANDNQSDKYAATSGAVLQLSGNNSLASAAREITSLSNSTHLQVASHILAVAENLAARQSRSIKLSLHPEELGEVEIQLTRNAQGTISAQLTAQRDQTRTALSQSLDYLRKTLERAGLTVDQIHISAGSSSLSNNRSAAHSHQLRPADVAIGNSSSSAEQVSSPEPPGRREKLLSLTA